MYNRKELKQNAKQSIKKHYFIFVLVCLIAGLLGTKYADTLTPQDLLDVAKTEQDANLVEGGTTTVDSGFQSIMNGRSIQKLLGDMVDKGLKTVGTSREDFLGRSRGVFATVVNTISSGTLMTTLLSAGVSIGLSKNVGLALIIIVSLALMLFVWFYVTNTYTAISARMFLEGRVYEDVPVHRFLHFLHIRRWTKAALIMFRATLYQLLWCFTIVGGIIKEYSYRMVPFIAAENPDISPSEAITLSRKMMDGHKLECFVLDLTFVGWKVLSMLTFTVSGRLFSNPYKEATFSEYYVYLRQLAKEKNLEGSELLKDQYLFEKADRMDLLYAYEKEIDAIAQPKPPKKERKGIFAFIADVFGVIFVEDKEEREYDAFMANREKYLALSSEMSGKAYPSRLGLHPVAEKQKKDRGLYCERHYSIWSLIMLFFTFAVIGWVWEVSLHLVSDGEFVNRGVLHGPWLPIYGTGGVLILVVLNKFRSKPILEFTTTIVLCGCVEYFTAWYLEATHGGQKWWDYSGYFLNLHGRICAEGLLVFGLGGMAIVYVAGPFLDNLFRKIKMQIMIPICAALLVVYCGDQMYSSKHPNTGKGITDYSTELPPQSNNVGIRSMRT